MMALQRLTLVVLLMVGGATLRAQTPYSTLTKLYSATDGTIFGGIVQAGDGSLYGVAYGAVPGSASVFRLTPAGTLTTLHQFTDADGSASLLGGLLAASDGNLYGTTSDGGSAMSGTVFRVTPDGGFATLHEFAGAAEAYPGGLFQAHDGSFYGYTSGQYPGGGTLFRLTPGGDFVVLYRFGDGDEATSFIQTPGGDFFGAALQDHASGIFQLAPGGTLTTINSFPKAGSLFNLLPASDGNFYGLSLYYIPDDNGPPINYLARVTPDGQRTDYFLDPGNGTVDHMIQGQDGNFYVTAVERLFASDDPVGGTVEAATPTGHGNAIYVFPPAEPGSDADYPTSGVMQAGDGSFYGTASGAAGAYVYRLTASFPVVTLGSATPEMVGGSGGSGKVRVTLSGAWPFDLNVYYKVRGNATPVSDFKANLGGVFKVPAGQTSAVLKIRPGSQPGRDGPRTLKLKLSAGGAYTMGAGTAAKIVIRAP